MGFENKLIRYETEIQIVPSSIRKLNPQFSLCDILVCYHGDNRNRTSLPKNVIEKCMYSIYGIPIIGEWIYKFDGADEKTWGSHGGRIIIDDNGIKFEQTTKPYGFVTKEAAETASWVTVTEKDGHTQNEYIKLTGCILWTERYEEAKSVLDKNYGQSMEVEFIKGHYRDDHYYEAEEFIFSALCILGTEHKPCFESACIGRHYELDTFKQDFALMRSEYEKYQKSGNENKGETKNKTKGENLMDFEEIKALLSAFTFKDCCGNEICKYSLIEQMSENKIAVIDKEDNFKVYSLDYALDDSGKPVIDWESKTEMSFALTEKTEDTNTSLSDLIDQFSQEKSNTVTEELSRMFNLKIDESEQKYQDLSKEFSEAKIKLETFEAEKAEIEKAKHKEEVNAIIKRYDEKIGRYPAFMVYKAKIDYSKTAAEIERELTAIAGQAVMNKHKKAEFEYIPNETDIRMPRNNGCSYAHLLDKYMNNRR